MADQIRRVDYYYVEVPDKPGEGVRVLGALKEAGVNLLSFTAFPASKGKAQIDVVALDGEALVRAAKNAGLTLSSRKQGFFIQGSDRVGAAAEVLRKLSSAGINVRRLNLYFLLIFSLTVIAELRFMGALLASALLIVPAATGRQLTNNFSRFLWVSSAVSVVAVGGGYTLDKLFMKGALPGPAVGIVAAVLFGLSILKRAAK